MDIDPLVLGLLAVALLAAALMNGLVGFGFALLGVNALALIVGAKSGIVIMSILAPLVSGMQIVRNRSRLGVRRRLGSLLAGAIVGSAIGTQLFVVLPAFVISLALGTFTAWFALTAMRGERPPLAEGTERRLAPFAGLVAGISNGTLGASGPVLGSYLTAIGLRGVDFVAAISLMFFSMGSIRVGLLGALGQYTVSLVLMSLVLFIPSYLGQRAGFWFQGRIRVETLQRAILVVLFLASLNLLIRGVVEAVTRTAN
jgi:uncharacterized membrane protein YfcA